MSNILVIGGGFGGLVTAKRLALELGKEHTITLVSPNRTFTFYPALVRLVFGDCSVDEITFDLPEALAELGVRYIQGEMTAVHPMLKRVAIEGGDINGEVSYDYLVIAIGRRLALGQIPGLREHAHHILGTKAAMKFSRAIDNFKEGKIVVGLSPGSRLPVAVCETAFALARHFDEKVKDGSISISVLFPGSLEDAFGGARLHDTLLEAFDRHKIHAHFDVPVSEVTKDEVLSTKKHRIHYDLLMLMPPFRGFTNLRELGIVDDDDFIKVDEKLRVEGMPASYAVGDAVGLSGPKLAHMAVRQAEVAAANIVSEIKGEEPREAYVHEVAAVIDSGGPDSIFLHYGVWKDEQTIKKGRFWSWAKDAHDAYWRHKAKK